METIKSERMREEYRRVEHPTGLTILMYPMPGFTGATAMFAANYGSVDVSFKTDGEAAFATVPEGIAHFLEHKLFESENGDAFTRYAKTGASANAYTSFDRTAYYFSCTGQFAESLEILLDFVTSPYFTPKTVEKEQGIIGQEIRMYEDSPEWRVYFNLLGALYHNNPVRVDIAGTVDSIAKIDAELLYRCYNTFYNLRNMVLTVAGSFDPDVVLAVADKVLKPAPEQVIRRQSAQEPHSIRERRVEQILPVAQPIFQVGFKGEAGSELENLRGKIMDELLIEIIAGDSSPLYRRLFDSELVNQTFEGEAMANRDYAMTIFSGESRDPDRVRDEICAEIDLIKSRGIDKAMFAQVKKAVYGRYVGLFGRVESVAGLLVTTHFSDVSAYEALDILAALTPGDLETRLNSGFDTGRCALSVVRGG